MLVAILQRVRWVFLAACVRKLSFPDVVVLDGVGHYPQVEAPGRVLEALLAFVDKVI